MRAMGNLCRYHDIKYDTNLHEQFTSWLKKKEIKWNTAHSGNNYHIASQISLNDVLASIDSLPPKYRIFGLFVLTTGLRTEESIMAYNNHSKICRDGVMELFWDRKTKKTNAVFCHPKIHDKITGNVNKSGIKRHMKSSILGCELRYLRKLNYTINATKLDPLLAEFMQGRRGNVSQRHYFLPLMNNYQRKWNKIWAKMII
jgi:intergrase/recombinase